jgi:uncharacterized membrane protein HdeD (DUF308 family)
MREDSDFPKNDGKSFGGRWWVLLVRGLTAVAFGALALAGPQVTHATLVILFGIYAFVHGILSTAAAIGGRGQRGCLLLGAEGMAGLVAGILTLHSSHPTAMAFVFVVWLWAVITGILRIAEAIRLKKEISGDIWLALSGLAAVLLSLMLFSRKIAEGGMALAIVIAIPAVIWGVFEILLGSELREARWRHSREPRLTESGYHPLPRAR